MSSGALKSRLREMQSKQVERDDPPPVLCADEATSRVMGPVLGS